VALLPCKSYGWEESFTGVTMSSNRILSVSSQHLHFQSNSEKRNLEEKCADVTAHRNKRQIGLRIKRRCFNSTFSKAIFPSQEGILTITSD
ncbi:hypothetical protein AVEN_21659-1, partial [Araneus ventricosus]